MNAPRQIKFRGRLYVRTADSIESAYEEANRLGWQLSSKLTGAQTLAKQLGSLVHRSLPKKVEPKAVAMQQALDMAFAKMNDLSQAIHQASLITPDYSAPNT